MSALAAVARRPRIVAGNWKMNRTAPDGLALVRELVALRAADPASTRAPRVVVCPPYPSLDAVGQAIAGSGVELGAQDVHAETHGAFTGCVSGAMLTAVGCRWAIVGHSERRQLMGETDAMVAAKLRAAQRDGLTPIVCVGETLAEREAGRTEEVLVRQVTAAWHGLSAEAARATVVAYEPVWAIGTGRNATADDAAAVIAVIRQSVRDMFGADTADELRIQYGGSVKPGNIAEFMAQPEIDGALVGSASIDPEEFARVVRYGA